MASYVYVFCGQCGNDYIENGHGCPYCTFDSSFYSSTRKLEDLLPIILEKAKNGELDYQGNVASIDYRDPFGNTLLMNAAAEGKTNLVSKLSDLGADVNSTNTEGFDALMLAAENSRFKTFKKLIFLGANYEYVSENGNSWKTVAEGKYIKKLEKFISKEMTAPKPGKK